MDIQTSFNPEIFLFTIYDIKSLDKCIMWANDNTEKQIRTVRRVIDCGFKTWYKLLENEIDEMIIIVFKDYVSKYYDKKIDYKTSKKILNKFYRKYSKSQDNEPLEVIEKILNVI
jgi:hypothetical protein